MFLPRTQGVNHQRSKINQPTKQMITVRVQLIDDESGEMFWKEDHSCDYKDAFQSMIIRAEEGLGRFSRHGLEVWEKEYEKARAEQFNRDFEAFERQSLPEDPEALKPQFPSEDEMQDMANEADRSFPHEESAWV